MVPVKSLGSVWEVSCRLKQKDLFAAEILEDVLVQCGIKSENLVERTDSQGTTVFFYVETSREVRDILKKVSGFSLKGVQFSSNLLEKSDWQDRWKEGIKPFHLTKAIDIVPRWAEVHYRKGRRRPLYIDTNLAFGTGLHETTRFMALLIESQSGYSSFLDVGTGTGILAIVAAFCGAKTIDAIDIDRQSIQVARENLKANQIENVKTFCADLSKWSGRRTYDFVAANLVTHDLIGFGRQLVQRVKKGKLLAVSGISLKKLPELRKQFTKLPLIEKRILRGKEWSAILYQRTGSTSLTIR